MATIGIYEMTDTWSSGVTTYQGIKMTVTDTGSGSGSTYLCACGSTGDFRITKFGAIKSNGTGNFGVQASPRNNNTFGGNCAAPCMADNSATGCFNTAFGDNAGESHTTSCYSSYFGAFAGYGFMTANPACVTLIGTNAGWMTPSTAQTAVGYAAAASGTNGACSVSIGFCANACGAAGAGRVGIGSFVSTNNSPTATAANVHVGYYAQASSTSSHTDVSIGNFAMCRSQTGNGNVSVGHCSGGYSNASATAPFLNTFVGNNAGAGQAGDYNTYVGRRAGGLCTMDTCCNTYIGYDTGLCNTVNNQIAIGTSTKPSNTANHTVWGNSSNNVCNCVWAAWSTVSDCRDKADITTLTDDYGLPFIQKLKPVSYKWDNRETYVRECKFEYGCRDGSFKGEKDNYGFLAQDIKETIEDLGISFDALGYTEEHDAYRLTYEDMIAPLTLAVQQLSKRVDVLETKKWAVCN